MCFVKALIGYISLPLPIFPKLSSHCFIQIGWVTWAIWAAVKKCLIQVRLGTEVLRTPSSTRLGFKLTTSRSWQYTSCHWNAFSNHYASSDYLQSQWYDESPRTVICGISTALFLFSTWLTQWYANIAALLWHSRVSCSWTLFIWATFEILYSNLLTFQLHCSRTASLKK